MNICIEKTPKSRKSVAVEKAIALGQGVQQPNSNNVFCILHTFNVNELKFNERWILTWTKVQGDKRKEKRVPRPRDPQKAATELLPTAQKFFIPPRAIFTFRNFGRGVGGKF